MMDLHAAADAIGARCAGPNVTFDAVTTDSREMPARSLFVALRGERFDGHTFADAALNAGAVAAMVDDAAAIQRPDASLLIVRDTRLALGELAAVWRRRFAVALIGVTGSNGKTTVKEMLAAILRAASSDTAVLATVGNLNNDIGMPLMLLRLRKEHRFAVIEMGMNHLGEIAYLTRLAQPDVAVINNAGVAHIGEVGSREAIAQAKGEIFEGVASDGIAVINADEVAADYWRRLNAARRVVDFGIDHPAQITAQYELRAEGSSVLIRSGAEQYNVDLSVPGLHNVRNALAAAAVAHALDISVDAIVRGLSTYAGTKGRLQRKRGLRGATLIDDTYNANPDSVRAAIAVLAGLPGKRVLVLGDMGELGSEAEALHRAIGEAARTAGIERLLTLGELAKHAAAAYGVSAQAFDDVGALSATLATQLDADVAVLVKGSRFMKMERVIAELLDVQLISREGEH